MNSPAFHSASIAAVQASAAALAMMSPSSSKGLGMSPRPGMLSPRSPMPGRPGMPGMPGMPPGSPGRPMLSHSASSRPQPPRPGRPGTPPGRTPGRSSASPPRPSSPSWTPSFTSSPTSLPHSIGSSAQSRASPPMSHSSSGPRQPILRPREAAVVAAAGLAGAAAADGVGCRVITAARSRPRSSATGPPTRSRNSGARADTWLLRRRGVTGALRRSGSSRPARTRACPGRLPGAGLR